MNTNIIALNDRALATVAGGTILDDLPTSISIDLGEGGAAAGAEAGAEAGACGGPVGVVVGLAAGAAIGYVASNWSTVSNAVESGWDDVKSWF